MVKDLFNTNIVCDVKNNDPLFFEFLKKELNFETKKNPDFLSIDMEVFGIDDARNFSLWVLGKPIAGDLKVASISTLSLTLEAQNALLKTLEEPPQGTFVFIHLENLAGLLPTLLSRVNIINLNKEAGFQRLENKEANNFLLSDFKKRLVISKAISNQENKNKIKEFLSELEIEANQNLDLENEYHKIKKIITAKVLSKARGSSPKMILEWLSCVI